MKTKITLFILISMSLNSFSQSWTQQIISTNVNEATSIYCADIDGDGDLDILSTSWFYDEVSWFENTDGQGTFSNKQTITSNADGADCVRAFDIDGDGDMDVLSSSYYDNKIAWYKNTDGQGTFGVQQVISTDLIYGSSVYAADIDGDGDLDVLSASIDDNKIAWYENTDGLGNFGSQQIIANPTQPNCVVAADLDGDGDNDILFDAASGNNIAWCENTDGLGTFATQQIISNDVIQPSSVYATDIDGDGDLDVISSSIQDNKIAWYENTDGLGTFGSQQIISTNANQARYVATADFDNDGDIDIVSASWNDDKIAWYENTDGLGNFGFQQIISTNADGASCVYVGDFNGDNKVDIVSSSYYDNKVAWYENTMVLGINENSLISFKLFPNPVKNFLEITTSNDVSKIEIFNSLGQKILIKLNSQIIDVSNIYEGIYFIKITTLNGNILTRKFIKE